MTIVNNFKFQECQPLAQVKVAFYKHYDYLIHKTHLADAWALFVADEQKYAELEAGHWVEINENVMIRKCQDSGELRWNHTEKYLAEVWAREMDLAAQLEQEQMGDDPFEAVVAAISGGAMLRVTRIDDGFEITLRLKNPQRSILKLHTRLSTGGLYGEEAIPFLEPFEFSMHRYQHNSDTRAATEYVRRKLTAEVSRVLKNRAEFEAICGVV